MNGSFTRIVLVLAVAYGFSSLGCDRSQSSAVAINRGSGTLGTEAELYSGDPTQIDPRFESRLREIATHHNLEFSLVIGGVRWAPELCLAPPMPTSAAAAGTPHGQKMYYLFVKDADAYAEAARQAQPVGQAIVKQSWIPEEVTDATQRTRAEVERGGKKYRAGRQADLFIMYKEEPDTEGTDQGWVYGTMTPDGQRVTSAGRVAACVECHKSAKPDHLFGAKSTNAAAED